MFLGQLAAQLPFYHWYKWTSPHMDPPSWCAVPIETHVCEWERPVNVTSVLLHSNHQCSERGGGEVLFEVLSTLGFDQVYIFLMWSATGQYTLCKKQDLAGKQSACLACVTETSESIWHSTPTKWKQDAEIPCAQQPLHVVVVVEWD